jgi:hypothetical protein
MPHDPHHPDSTLLDETRRHLFARCGVGVGAMALGALLAGEGRGAGEGAGGPLGVPGLPGLPHPAGRVAFLAFKELKLTRRNI